MAFILNIVFAVGAALSLVYAARTTGSTFSLEDGFKQHTMDVVREYDGQISMHDFVDKKMWSMIFTSWCLLFIYQFLTYFSSSSKGLVYTMGHIPWSFNALCLVAMFGHVNWLRLLHAKDLFGSLAVVFVTFYLFTGALILLLYTLYKKTPELEECGLKKDVIIMRVIVINATDFYCTYTFFSAFSILDAYLVNYYEVSPDNSNFYLMTILAVAQVVNIWYDLRLQNWLVRYLAGGYITLIIGTVGIMLYQIVTLPHLPMVTLLNVVLAVLCPLVKIQVQSNQPAETKLKEKAS